MIKHILIFEDNNQFVDGLVFRMAEYIKKTGTDLALTHERCATYNEALLKLNDIEQTQTEDNYDLIIIDLKLPFVSAIPEKNADVKFLGLLLTKLIRQKFGDRIQYVPITSLLAAVKNLDPVLHDVDQLDIDTTMDKRTGRLLAEDLVKMLTQDPPLPPSPDKRGL